MLPCHIESKPCARMGHPGLWVQDNESRHHCFLVFPTKSKYMHRKSNRHSAGRALVRTTLCSQGKTTLRSYRTVADPRQFRRSFHIYIRRSLNTSIRGSPSLASHSNLEMGVLLLLLKNPPCLMPRLAPPLRTIPRHAATVCFTLPLLRLPYFPRYPSIDHLEQLRHNAPHPP